MKLETLTTLVNLFNAASKDETRINLNGVNVECIEFPHFKFTATDGHILSHAVIEDDLLSMASNTSFIIPRSSLPALKTYLAQRKKEVGHAYSEFKDDILSLGSCLTIPALQREYPKYQAVIPVKLGEVKISFNADLITSLTKTLGKRKANIITLHVDLDKETKTTLKPIHVTATNVNTVLSDNIKTMVLMPCKAK